MMRRRATRYFMKRVLLLLTKPWAMLGGCDLI